MWRSLLWVVAIALSVGVGYVAVDAAMRSATLNTFTRGMGTPDNPSREEVRLAEWNLVYLLGLGAGAASGVGVAVAAGLLWRLARPRRPAATPGTSSDGEP